MKHCILALITLLFVVHTSSTAQTIDAPQQALIDILFNEHLEQLPGESNSAYKQRQIIRNGIREKLRVTPDELIRMMEQDHRDDHLSISPESRTYQIAEGLRETAVNDGDVIESELHAVINPTDSNNLVVGVINSGGGGGSNTSIYFTKDFGQTWQKSAFQPKANGITSIVGGGDPVFAFTDDGLLYYSWIDFSYDQANAEVTNVTAWALSTDGGETWRQEENDRIGEGRFGQTGEGDVFDKQWMIVDRTDSKYRGNLYTGLVHGESGFSGNGLIGLRVKPADSSTFIQTTIRVPGEDWHFNQLASPQVGADGTLYMMFVGTTSTDTGRTALYLTHSTDGGATLQPAIKITDIQVPVLTGGQEDGEITGFNQDRIQPSSHLAADISSQDHKGNLYAVWAANGIDKKLDYGMDIYFTRSTDGGATWATPIVVNDDRSGEIGRGDADQFHPSIAVNNEGIISVSWYDRRDDPENVQTHYYITHSFDGGKTFVSDIPVSSQPADFSQIGSQNLGFGIGEYVQTVSSPHYAIPFWSDGRKNNGDIDIYVAFVPLSERSSGIERFGTVTEGMSLEGVTPNPIAHHGTITCEIKQRGELKVDIIDIHGKVVTVLHNDMTESGRHIFHIEAKDLTSGRYLVRMETDKGLITEEMTVVR